jgi:F420-dependent oxidoreductase-like protein
VARFGLQLPSFTFPDATGDRLFDRVIEIAQAAEESGFGSFWVMDHFEQIRGVGPREDAMLEGYTALAAVAARTSALRLGTLVSGVIYRNPALVAKVVTTLDVISKGRAILGMGAAWNDQESGSMGFEFPSVKERMDRLEEAVQICRLMFTQDRASFEGRHYRIREVFNNPRPIQAGGPPIMIGGGGEQRTLRLVAKYADACNLFGDPATVAHKLEVLAGHCEAVGRDPSAITITRLGTMVLSKDGDDARRRAREWAERTAWGQVTPEVRLATAAAGDPDDVSAYVQALIDAGVDELIFNFPAGTSPEEVAFAGQVLTERFGD